MGMYDNLYDVNAGAAGQASQASPEERQMQRLQRMISAAEYSNYDGDPDYYNQIKAMAMQAGIPIKKFKTNPFRAAGIFGASMLDTAMLGLLPNELYTPEGGHVSGVDAAADTMGMLGGMALPFGLPAKLAGGAMKMGGRALSGQSLNPFGAGGGAGLTNYIKSSPRLMKMMGIQPAGTKAAANAAKNLVKNKAANIPLQLASGQKQLPVAAQTGSARDVFGGYQGKKAIKVPKSDSYVGKGTPKSSKEIAATAKKKTKTKKKTTTKKTATANSPANMTPAALRKELAKYGIKANVLKGMPKSELIKLVAGARRKA